MNPVFNNLNGCFVTGTDTGIGKTYYSHHLLTRQRALGRQVAAMKPIASGCLVTPQGLRNEDALQLIAACDRPLVYDLVNPYAFEPAIAPHLAAGEAGVRIDFDVIEQRFERLRADSDFVLVEGVGGWLVPLADHLDVADMARRLDLPVIMVVGIRLGCINHALLTAQAIRVSGVTLLGWVANCVDPAMERRRENIVTLQRLLPEPLLEELDWQT